jgi:hypothetical protein
VKEDGSSAIRRRGEKLWGWMCDYFDGHGWRDFRPICRRQISCVEYIGVLVGIFYVLFRYLKAKAFGEQWIK